MISVSSSWIIEALWRYWSIYPFPRQSSNSPWRLVYWSQPKTKKSLSAFFHIWNIAKNRNIFTHCDPKKRVQVFVTSRLDNSKGCCSPRSISSGRADGTIPIQKTSLLSECCYTCGSLEEFLKGKEPLAIRPSCCGTSSLSSYRRLTPPPRLKFSSYSDNQSH